MGDGVRRSAPQSPYTPRTGFQLPATGLQRHELGGRLGGVLRDLPQQLRQHVAAAVADVVHAEEWAATGG